MRKLNKIITTAAMVAAILAGTAPKAAATGCPYTVGPLGRYIAPAIVQGMTATDDGAVEVWCTDALDGDDWYFLVDAETDLRIYDRAADHCSPQHPHPGRLAGDFLPYRPDHRRYGAILSHRL